MAIITTAGKGWIVLKLQNSAPAANALMSVLTWGTGTQSEATVGAAADPFTQFTESAEARVTGTLSVPSALIDRLVGTINATAARVISQVMRTNVTTVGGAGQTGFGYAQFTGLSLATGDGIQFQFDHVVA